ncbi:MAG: amidohydrolase [Ruminococcaceae bacterium]|nr:amidohydrolase [Oscillospiraceae bacterium]
MKIIDAHCHIYPDKIAEKAAAATGRFYDIEMSLDGKVSTLMREGTAAGIDHFIVQSVATTPAQVGSINRFIAEEVARSGGKMTGLGTLHPDSEDIAGDVEQLLELGLRGVKLHPDIQGFKLDDYRCLKIYELCEGRLPLLLHTGDHRYDFSNPNRLKPILDTYTELTVIGAHFGGWSIWEKAAEQLHGYDRLYVDCSSSLYAISPDVGRRLVRCYGADRVLFGTDYPMWSPAEELDRFYAMGLTAEENRKILCDNAATLFSIEI